MRRFTNRFLCYVRRASFHDAYGSSLEEPVQNRCLDPFFPTRSTCGEESLLAPQETLDTGSTV